MDPIELKRKPRETEWLWSAFSREEMKEEFLYRTQTVFLLTNFYFLKLFGNFSNSKYIDLKFLILRYINRKGIVLYISIFFFIFFSPASDRSIHITTTTTNKTTSKASPHWIGNLASFLKFAKIGIPNPKFLFSPS